MEYKARMFGLGLGICMDSLEDLKACFAQQAGKRNKTAILTIYTPISEDLPNPENYIIFSIEWKKHENYHEPNMVLKDRYLRLLQLKLHSTIEINAPEKVITKPSLRVIAGGLDNAET